MREKCTARNLNSGFHIIGSKNKVTVKMLTLSPVMENSCLLFSSCHQELVVLENSQLFACYYLYKNRLFSKSTSSV